MENILKNIENSIPENIKIDLRKRIATSSPVLLQLADHLKHTVVNSHDMRSLLFNNDDDAIYFSGDILSKTLYNFWIIGGKIQDHFFENLQMSSYTNRFKCPLHK
jgi:hypothetical protein